jgi:hypothetical protein
LKMAGFDNAGVPPIIQANMDRIIAKEIDESRRAMPYGPALWREYSKGRPYLVQKSPSDQAALTSVQNQHAICAEAFRRYGGTDVIARVGSRYEILGHAVKDRCNRCCSGSDSWEQPSCPRLPHDGTTGNVSHGTNVRSARYGLSPRSFSPQRRSMSCRWIEYTLVNKANESDRFFDVDEQSGCLWHVLSLAFPCWSGRSPGNHNRSRKHG